jgi:hypothetical protein
MAWRQSGYSEKGIPDRRERAVLSPTSLSGAWNSSEVFSNLGLERPKAAVSQEARLTEGHHRRCSPQPVTFNFDRLFTHVE